MSRDDKPQKISIGFHGGQTLAARVTADRAREATRRPRQDGGWHESRAEDGLVVSTSLASTTCWSTATSTASGSELRLPVSSWTESCSPDAGRAATTTRGSSSAIAAFSRSGRARRVWFALGASGAACTDEGRAHRAWKRGIAVTGIAYGLNTAVKSRVKRPRPSSRTCRR